MLALTISGMAQSPKFSYSAQKKFIHPDLGKVYLGMPLKEFAELIPIGKAEADGRFEFLQLDVPFETKNIKSISIRAHDISREEMRDMLLSETETAKSDDGEEYDRTVERIEIEKIPKTAFVYAIYISFKPKYDLKSYVTKTFGEGEVRKPDDEFYFFDIQWTKTSSDGLKWLIRSFHEGDSRSLQLLGRIDNTEWGLN